MSSKADAILHFNHNEVPFKKPTLRKCATALALVATAKPPTNQGASEDYNSCVKTSPEEDRKLGRPGLLIKRGTHAGNIYPKWRTTKAVVAPTVSRAMRFKNSAESSKSCDSSLSSNARSWASTSSASSALSAFEAARSIASSTSEEQILRTLINMPGLSNLPIDDYISPEQLVVDFSDMDRILLGEGGQAKIFKAVLHEEEVAVKMSEDPHVLAEYALIHQMKHPCIIKPIAFTVAKGSPSDTASNCSEMSSDCGLMFLAVYQNCRNGDLAKFLDRNPHKALDERFLNKAFDSVLAALDHIHNSGFLHTDIKPENILVTHEENIVLADFGMCQPFSDRMIAQGTPSYLSPEMVMAWHSPQDPHRYTGASDIFSFGVLLVNVATGKYPFQRITARLRRVKPLTTEEFDAIFVTPSKRIRELSAINPRLAVIAKLALRVSPEERSSPDFLRAVLNNHSSMSASASAPNLRETKQGASS